MYIIYMSGMRTMASVLTPDPTPGPKLYPKT